MLRFKSTNFSTLPAIIEPMSESAKFWKNNLQPAIVSKELNAINCIDINNVNEILTTSSIRISLYETFNLEVKRTFSSPNHTLLYNGTFRKDNAKIFASGAADGVVRIWDVKKSKPLRLMGSSEKSKKHNHTAAVHRVNFNGVNQLYSCGDDKSIKLWDITEDSVITTFGNEHSHQDYIRASATMENFSSIASGSYDQTVKIWDHRTPQNCTFQFNHGAPVESITCRDFMVISAGETSIKIFDVIAGKVIRTIEKIHHKTITNLYNHGNYILSTSIDGHLKVFDTNFYVASSFSYVPSQLLSCCFNGSLLAVGTVDGILSVNKIRQSKGEKANITKEKNDSMSDEFIFDSIPLEKDNSKWKKPDSSNTVIVKPISQTRFTLEKHDDLLRKFKYSSALDRVIRFHRDDKPELVVNLMQELIRRKGLKIALAGRLDGQLYRVIMFLCRNLSDPRFSRTLMDVGLALVEIYCDQINRSSAMQSMFRRLNQTLSSEIDNLTMMCQLSGQLQILINSQIK
ncbi:hypothetical protein RDWZM_001869 [Blomia tropicalis]|uniref:U3 small nucleolar RNA-associated protein 15 homolog n=1 Tax=Blomia tropicalis TaxID=40697 RepID=A0A9Q0MD87_BLOTA|nr:hypothetical protein RDWZM_001869 [Blomia tropicalis]